MKNEYRDFSYRFSVDSRMTYISDLWETKHEEDNTKNECEE